jgi:hypothetical protein
LFNELASIDDTLKVFSQYQYLNLREQLAKMMPLSFDWPGAAAVVAKVVPVSSSKPLNSSFVAQEDASR